MTRLSDLPEGPSADRAVRSGGQAGGRGTAKRGWTILRCRSIVERSCRASLHNVISKPQRGVLDETRGLAGWARRNPPVCDGGITPIN